MPGGFRRKRGRDDRRVRVDGNGLRRDVVGENGLVESDLLQLATGLDARAEVLERQARVGWAALSAGKAELRRILRLRDDLCDASGDVLLLTNRESGDGVRALASALRQDAAPGVSDRRLHVVDGADPERCAALVATLDWHHTVCVVVSAGEADVLTAGHFLIVRDHLLRELGAVAYQRHVVFVIPAGESAFDSIVHDEGFRSFALSPDDAYPSLLGPAGLVPLALLGVDVAELVSGGTAMLDRRLPSDGARPAQLLATALQLAAPCAIRTAPPSVQGLHPLAGWMERRLAIDAAAAYVGGAGRRRVTVVLDVASHAPVLAVPNAYQDVESLGCVGGRDLGDLAAQAREADELARWTTGELTLAILLPDASAYALGQVIALTEAVVALVRTEDAGTSLRAHASRVAFGLLGRPGYEAERTTAERLMALREERWVA